MQISEIRVVGTPDELRKLRSSLSHLLQDGKATISESRDAPRSFAEREPIGAVGLLEVTVGFIGSIAASAAWDGVKKILTKSKVNKIAKAKPTIKKQAKSKKHSKRKPRAK